MRNKTPSYSSSVTIAELRTSIIPSTKWPDCPPNLNLIESFWNKFNYFIQDKYTDLGERR